MWTSCYKNDIIEESPGGPWSSPVVLVHKANNKEYRFCLNMRNVNKPAKINSYPLPRIDNTLDALNGSKFFSSLDLRSVHQRMDEDSKDLTTFVMHIGSFSFICMPYGVVNASAIFQKLIEKVLYHLHWHICMTNLDNVIVLSRYFRSHLDNKQVLTDCVTPT